MKDRKTNNPNIIYASFFTRLISTLIDLLILGILFIPIFSITSSLIYGGVLPSEVMLGVTQDMKQLITEGKQINNLMSFLKNNQRFNDYFFKNNGFIKICIDQFFQLSVFAIVLFVFWIKKQATLGKICLSLKIVDADTLLKPSSKQLFLRLIGCVISVLPFCLGIIWIAFDPKKQAWHDKIANTLVIKNRKTV